MSTLLRLALAGAVALAACHDGDGTPTGAAPSDAAAADAAPADANAPDGAHTDGGHQGEPDGTPPDGGSPDTGAPPSVTLTPAEVTLGPGQSQAFSASFTGAPAPLEWLVEGVVGGAEATGTVSADGVYTAPLAFGALAQVTVTARALADPSVSGSATVLFAEGPFLGIANPGPLVVGVGQALVLAATSAGVDAAQLTWSLETDPPRFDLGTLHPKTGLYRAPDLLPDPPVDLIEVVVRAGGLEARAPLLIQELRFEPPEIRLTEDGEAAAFDVRERLSDGTDRSVLGEDRISFEVYGPPFDTPVTLAGDTVTATAALGSVLVVARDAASSGHTGMKVHNMLRPVLHVDGDDLVHGLPGATVPLAVERRGMRGGTVWGGPDIAADPRLAYEALDPGGAVLEEGEAPPPGLVAAIAWAPGSATPHVVFGDTPGVASFRVFHTTEGLEVTFDVELLPTWLTAYGRGPGTKTQIWEIGKVPAGAAEPWTGSDVSLTATHLSGEVQDLVVMLWGEAPDDPRWSLLSADDLGTGRTVVWEVVEGHGFFLGPETGEVPLLAAPDLATGTYVDGPLAGRAWARRSLATDALDRYLQAAYGDKTSWKGMRGSFVRFVATRPGPVVIEARLDGSPLQPVRWELDCLMPVLKLTPFTGYPTGVPPVVGNTIELRLTQVRDPSLPSTATPAYQWVPPHRVEIRRPSGELLEPEKVLFYVRPEIQDRAYFLMDEPGAWAVRLVYDAAGEDAPTPWAPFDVVAPTDWAAQGFGYTLVMVDQSDDVFVPGQTVITLQALGPDGPVATTVGTDRQGNPVVDGASFVHYPDLKNLGAVSVIAGAPAGAGLRGRWWPVGPYLFIQELLGTGTLDSSVGALYPAAGSSTIQLVLELDPESTWNPAAIAPATAVTSAPVGRGVFFDPPALVPPAPACVTPAAAGHEAVLHLVGAAALEAAAPDLTPASVETDRPWMTATAVEPAGLGRVDVHLAVDLGAAGAEAFGPSPHTIRLTTPSGLFEAPFRLWRPRLSGWRPDLAAGAQLPDDPAVGLPLNARFTGPGRAYAVGAMPAQLHVEGHVSGAPVTVGTRSADGALRTATSRLDHTTDDDGPLAHAPLQDEPLTVRVTAVAGAPASYELVAYGDLTDTADNGTKEPDSPDGLPDAVSPGPGAEELWVACEGREADALPFTAFAFRAVPVGDLRAPATALGAPTLAGEAGYAERATFAGAPEEGDDLEVRVDVDHAAPGHVSALSLAHAKDRDGRAALFDGARLTAKDPDALPPWLEGTGGAATWGVELDGLCFDPDVELLPTGDAPPGDPSLYPPDHVPPTTALGFLDDEGGASGGVVGTTGAAWGRLQLVAETPGARWPGLDCGHPYAGTAETIGAQDDDLEDVAAVADESGVVDLAAGMVAALAESLDRPEGVSAAVQISGERFGYVWTTLPEAGPGVPVLAADLVGTLLVGEEPRFQPVAPGEPGWHPDGTCTEGVDDDLVVTARRYTGGSGEATLIGLRIAVDTLMGGLAAATFVTLIPAAIATTPFWYVAGQGGIALVTSYVSELNGLATGESVVVGKLAGKAGGKVGSRVATRASLWGLRIFGANLGTKTVAGGVGVGFADEATSALGTALAEVIKRTSLTTGDSVVATAQATVAETLSVRVPDECAVGEGGARVALFHAARTVSIASDADFREEPPGDVIPSPSQGGQTRAHVERCVSLSGSPLLVLSPGAPLGAVAGPPIQGTGAAPGALTDFRIVVREGAEPWGLTRSASAVAGRSGPAGTARVRLRADGALFFRAYGLQVEAIHP